MQRCTDFGLKFKKKILNLGGAAPPEPPAVWGSRWVCAPPEMKSWLRPCIQLDRHQLSAIIDSMVFACVQFFYYSIGIEWLCDAAGSGVYRVGPNLILTTENAGPIWIKILRR